MGYSRPETWARRVAIKRCNCNFCLITTAYALYNWYCQWEKFALVEEMLWATVWKHKHFRILRKIVLQFISSSDCYSTCISKCYLFPILQPRDSLEQIIYVEGHPLKCVSEQWGRDDTPRDAVGGVRNLSELWNWYFPVISVKECCLSLCWTEEELCSLKK